MRTKLPSVIALALLAATVHAEPNTTQPTGTTPTALIRLWPGDAPATQPFDATDHIAVKGGGAFWVSGVRTPSLAAYVPKSATPTAAAIICPGGGYAFESYTSEGTKVAEKLNEHGIAGFVLKYRLPDGTPPADGALPVPQQDVLRAIQVVRSQAAKWNLDPDKIGVIGFSAGGHLASTAATLFDQAPKRDDAAGRASARPDFAVLMYPVITMTAGATHGGSRKNLIGQDAPPELTARFSSELNVTKATPPLFIVHAEDDKTVPIKNAFLINAAAETAGVPHELIVFQKGGHGFGLGNPKAESGTWFDKCMTWLASRHVIDAK